MVSLSYSHCEEQTIWFYNPSFLGCLWKLDILQPYQNSFNINRGINKEDVVPIYIGILLSH